MKNLCQKLSAAFSGTTGSAPEASFLVDQAVGSAFGADLAFFHPCSVGYVFAQGTLNAVFPGVDGIAVEPEGRDQVNDIGNRHAMTQYAGY